MSMGYWTCEMADSTYKVSNGADFIRLLEENDLWGDAFYDWINRRYTPYQVMIAMQEEGYRDKTFYQEFENEIASHFVEGYNFTTLRSTFTWHEGRKAPAKKTPKKSSSKCPKRRSGKPIVRRKG